MIDKFRKKYRVKSARLVDWNFSTSGYYFITICTKNRENFLGEIRNQKMFLSPIGTIVQKYWREIPQHFPFVRLDKFVVMPNHLHGILILARRDEALPRLYNDSATPRLYNDPATPRLYNDPALPRLYNDPATPRLYNGPHPQMSEISPQPKSLPVIIGSFKSICTKHARAIRQDFAWQSRYYDHIIRDEEEHNNIQAYILSNPENWEKDVENLRN